MNKRLWAMGNRQLLRVTGYLRRSIPHRSFSEKRLDTLKLLSYIKRKLVCGTN